LNDSIVDAIKPTTVLFLAELAYPSNNQCPLAGNWRGRSRKAASLAGVDTTSTSGSRATTTDATVGGTTRAY